MQRSKHWITITGTALMLWNSGPAYSMGKSVPELAREIEKHAAAINRCYTEACKQKTLMKKHKDKADACMAALSKIIATEDLVIEYLTSDEVLKLADPRLTHEKLRAVPIGTRVSTTVTENSVPKIGAIFERVVREGSGETWQEIKIADDGTETKGLAYSTRIGKFLNTGSVNKAGIIESNDEKTAAGACKKIGGTLPTRAQFEEFAKKFDRRNDGIFTDSGIEELHRLFPDMKGQLFCSSSSRRDDSNYAFIFNGDYGNITSAGPYDNYSLLCVWP